MTLCSMEAQGPWAAGSCTSGTLLLPPPPPRWPSPAPSPTRPSGASSSESCQEPGCCPSWRTQSHQAARLGCAQAALAELTAHSSSCGCAQILKRSRRGDATRAGAAMGGSPATGRASAGIIHVDSPCLCSQCCLPTWIPHVCAVRGV